MTSDLVKFRGAVYRLADQQDLEQTLIQEAGDMFDRVARELGKFGVVPITTVVTPTIDSDVGEAGNGWATAEQDFRLDPDQRVGTDTELLDNVRAALNDAGFGTLQLQKRQGPAIFPRVKMVFGVDHRKDRLVYIFVEPAGAQDSAGRFIPIILVTTYAHE